MRFCSGIFISFLTLAALGCNPTEEKAAIFPQRIGNVNDYEDVFSDVEERALDSLAKDFKSRTSVELVIVTVDSAMAPLDKFNSYTLQMSKRWEIGNKDKKNGILIGISSTFQRVRINRGLGVKGLKDADVRVIMDDYMFPELRKGNYFEGTRIAIAEMDRAIKSSVPR